MQLERLIGSGSMGVVWAGTHVATGVPVAIKTVHPVPGDPAAQQAWFLDEVRLMASLDHPHVVRVFDHGLVSSGDAAGSGGELVEGHPYLVTEFAHGGTLFPLCGRLPWKRVEAILAALLQALAHGHAREVLHRDIKPSNVLAEDPRDFRPGIKLTDYGLARRAFDDRRLNVVGTPLYMPREQMNAQRSLLGPWTDLYALGGLAWQLVTGSPPFGHLAPDQVWSAQMLDEPGPFRPRVAVPPHFEAWCRQLLNKDPLARFGRAADALDAMSPGQRTPPRSPSEPPQTGMHPTLAGLGQGLLGLRTPPMIGRGDARRTLWDALERVQSTGRTQVVLLEGEAGQGKTRLARWLTWRAHEDGRVEFFRTEHGPGPSPLHGLAALLEQTYRTHGVTRSAAERMLRREAGRGRAPSNPIERKALLNLFRPTASLNHTPEAAHSRHALTRRALGALAVPRVPLVVLEDVEWSEEAVPFARAWLDDPSAVPALLVLTHRVDPEGHGSPALSRLLASPDCQRVRLFPLSRHQVRELVQGLLVLDRQVEDLVAERADGNPLIATQLVSSWVSAGLLEQTLLGFRLSPGAAPQVPDDIHELWDRRLARAIGAGPSDRTALEAAAVLGQSVHDDEWRRATQALGIAPEGLVLLLARLKGAGLVRTAPRGFTFVHRLLQESLLERARAHSRWRTLNAACAAAVAKGRPGTDRRRGQHLLAAGRIAEARPHLLRAAAQARRAGQVRAAAELLDGLQLEGAPPRIQADAARAAYFLGGNTLDQDRMATAATACEALLTARDPSARAVAGAVRARWIARERPADAVPLARKAWQDARKAQDPHLRGMAGEALTYCLTWAGQLDAALDAQRRTADAWEQAGRSAAAAQARAQSVLTPGASHAQLDVGIAEARRAARLFSRAGDRANAASALNILGELLRKQGELHRAAQAYLNAKPLAEAADRSLLCGLALNLGMVHLELGNLEAAAAAGRRALREAEAQQDALLRTCAHSLLLAPRALQRDPEHWRESLDQVREGLALSDMREVDLARCYLYAVRAAQLAGRPEREAAARSLADAQLAGLGLTAAGVGFDL